MAVTLTLSIHRHIQISNLTIHSKDLPQMILIHVLSQFLHNNLEMLVTILKSKSFLTFVLRNGGLLLRERLLVRRPPLRAGLGVRDLGEMVRLGLDGDLERESYEAGLFERVRSLPLEIDREGIVGC